MTKDKPILTSLLQNDFYKFSMWYLIYKHFRDVDVTFGFVNRTKSVELGKELDIGEIREEFDHARNIVFTKNSLHWLAGTYEYGETMFPVEFIEYIKNFKLPEYSLERCGNDLKIHFPGRWLRSSQWEIPCLMIINTLINRKRLSGMTAAEKIKAMNEAESRLIQKIKRIQIYRYKNRFSFSDFGTRRCFSPEWHDHVVEMLVDHVPEQLRGTSNCYLAQKYGLMAMGTRAHEPEMVMAALAENDETLARTPFEFCTLWSPGTYGRGLQTHLPDTFGSDYFYKNASPEMAKWGSVRQDSGDPYIMGMKAVKWFEKHGQDTKTKKLIPSDGLDINLMLKLHAHFIDMITVSPGWGTNLTNDVPGIKPLSIVVKPIEANGKPTVKLSDNIAKAMGKEEEVERYKNVFKYHDAFNRACTY
jgi:nicotinate phosphoribosyltransferase